MRHHIDDELLAALPEAGWNVVIMPADYPDLVGLGIAAPQGPALMHLTVDEARAIADTLLIAVRTLRPTPPLAWAQEAANRIVLLQELPDVALKERCYGLVRRALDRLLLTLPR